MRQDYCALTPLGQTAATGRRTLTLLTLLLEARRHVARKSQRTIKRYQHSGGTLHELNTLLVQCCHEYFTYSRIWKPLRNSLLSFKKAKISKYTQSRRRKTVTLVNFCEAFQMLCGVPEVKARSLPSPSFPRHSVIHQAEGKGKAAVYVRHGPQTYRPRTFDQISKEEAEDSTIDIITTHR